MKKTGICLLSLLLALLLSVSTFAAVPGDVDGNGEVEVDDARLALRAAVGLEDYAPGTPEFVAADRDFNGEIGVDDARTILRAAVGLETLRDAPAQPVVSDAPLRSKEIYQLAKTYTFEIHTETAEYSAIGSGFALTADGEIVTNYHVIADAEKISVFDYDEKEYKVLQVVAFDRDVDLAVLKVEGTLTPAALDRTDYDTGDTVYTLGSANGYTGTFANGVISNARMPLPDYNKKVTYIQTSAPISGGNSGGPLIDEYGRVVGVNTLTDEQGQNLNFAIPVSYLDGLDRSAPRTVEEFNKAELAFKSVFVYYGDDTPHIRVGGTAVVVMNGVSHDPATLACKCKASVLRASMRGGFLYITALKACENEPVTVYMPEFPDVSYDVLVTASPAGKTTFGLFDEAPDFGALMGVAPTFVSLDTVPLLSRLPGVAELSGENFYPILSYDFSGKNKKPDDVRGAYEKTLTDAGFTLANRSLLGGYTYVNEKTGVTVTYVESRRFGTLRSVSLTVSG